MRDMNKIKGTNVYWVELLSPSKIVSGMPVVVPVKELFVKKASIFSFKGIKMLFKIYVLNKFKPDFERSYFEKTQ